MPILLSRRTLMALAGFCLAGMAGLGSPQPVLAADQPVIVFGAASLKNAVDDAAAAWKAKTGGTVNASYAASSAIARQIEQGAPADIFFSADLDWMDKLKSENLIKTETEHRLLGNRLVLIAPADSKAEIEMKPGLDLTPLVGDGRIALCDPAVPAGKYGIASLQALGAWDAVKDKTANADSVRAALALVSHGETPLGIVYATDAKVDPGVRVLGAFPENTHPPIVYPVALTASSQNPQAKAFLDFLLSADAKSIFEAQGFTVLPPSS